MGLFSWHAAVELVREAFRTFSTEVRCDPGNTSGVASD